MPLKSSLAIAAMIPFAAFALDSGASAANLCFPEPMASWSEETKEAQGEAAKDLVARLAEAVKRGDREFKIAPGDYRFGSAGGPANFILSDVKDMRIEAAGATFWINGRVRNDGVFVRRCRNVAITGLCIDADPYPCTQGEILSLEPERKAVVIRIDPGFPDPSDWKMGGNVKAPVFAPDGRMRDMLMDWVSALEPLGEPGLFRSVFMHGRIFEYPTDVAVGDRLALPDRTKRMAVNTIDSEAVRFEGVTVYAAPHMAFTEEFGEGGNVYRNCRVVKRPGTKRLLACNADIFHSGGTRKGPLIEGCEFSWSGDDFVNIHGFLSFVYERRSPTEIVAFNIKRQSFEAGSELEFYGKEACELKGRAKIVSVTPLNDPALLASIMELPGKMRDGGERVLDFPKGQVYPCLLKLDAPVEAGLLDLVNDYSMCGRGTVIRNSSFHDGYARGILVKGRDTLIEGNQIERAGILGILIASDRFFLEGPISKEVVIRGNKLVDCGRMLQGRVKGGGSQGAISVWTGGPNWTYMRSGFQNSKVLIEGNTITRSGMGGIFMANCKDSVIRGNVIESPFSPGPSFKNAEPEVLETAYPIYLDCSEKVSGSGNKVVNPGPASKGDVGLGPSVKNCSVK